MTKNKLKLIVFIIVAILCVSIISFATDPEETSAEVTSSETTTTAEDDVPISEDTSADTDANVSTGDLTFTGFDYTLDKVIDGNAYINATNFTMDPKNSGGNVRGNLYVMASTVNIKADITYSQTEKDEEGNPAIEDIASSSVIYGNGYIVAQKVIIESGCEINGDLYIAANEIEISPNAIVYGTVYVYGGNLKLNGLIGRDLYVTGNKVEMSYHGFVNRDLHIDVNTAIINGVIYRDSYIEAKNLITKKDFVNHGNVEANASSIIFMGEVKLNATFNAKNINIITASNIEENKSVIQKNKSLSFLLEENYSPDFVTTIGGNLNYTSAKELSLDNVVTGEKTFTKYSSVKSILTGILAYLISTCTILVATLVVYYVFSRKSDAILDVSLNVKNALISIGIGIALLIVVPLAFILLSLTVIGTIVGSIIAILYLLLLVLAIPTSIIALLKLIGDKLNPYISIVIITAILGILLLIPYISPLVTCILITYGSGSLAVSKFKK